MTGNEKASIWRRLGEMLGIVGNAYDKSYEDKRQSLQSQLAERFPGDMDGGMPSSPGPYILDMYDDYVVYQKDGQYYSLGYEEKDGNCVLSKGAPEEVERVTSYEPTKNAGTNQPRSKNTGAYKRTGAGMGKGAVHEAAQTGAALA